MVGVGENVSSVELNGLFKLVHAGKVFVLSFRFNNVLDLIAQVKPFDGSIGPFKRRKAEIEYEIGIGAEEIGGGNGGGGWSVARIPAAVVGGFE